MADRTLLDGNIVKQNLISAGTGKLFITPADNEGTVGQVLTSGGPGVQPNFVNLPVASSNATIDFQRFNSSGTWTKPAGLHANSPVLIRNWPGGGGGELSANNSPGQGGGGGGFNDRWTTLGALAATETVTIGAGGLGRVTTTASGGNGGNSSFGALLTVYGGLGGGPGGGDGGGPMNPAVLGNGGRIVYDATGTNSFFHGQGAVATGLGAQGIYHGGGGGLGANAGGQSLYAGAGGAGHSATVSATGGIGIGGGNGGNSGANGASATAGVQPAGGGGSAENTGGASSGAGGPGRIDVIVFGFPA